MLQTFGGPHGLRENLLRLRLRGACRAPREVDDVAGAQIGVEAKGGDDQNPHRKALESRLRALGSRVQVQVSRVDLDGRKIDFRLIRAGDGSELQTQGNGKKSSSKKRPYVHEPEDQALSEGEIEAEIHASARSSKRSTASRSKAAVSSSKTASASTAPATPDKRSRSKLSPADKSERRKDG